MIYYNIKKHEEQVSFIKAVKQGLGSNRGLFFPMNLPIFSELDMYSLLKMDFVNRSAHILHKYIGDEISKDIITQCVTFAFTFPALVIWLNSRIAVLELFHGPTLAFKDFGSRFMAQLILKVNNDNPITILTATSGDTGAAVAHAFYGYKNINVVILYPHGKVSVLQEKLFCTLGKNIYTIAVDGDFDACQSLVKCAFDDKYIRNNFGLNSANSINISRLLAQICYYFEAVSQIPERFYNNIVISVPSGNFGNLTAGLLAQASGLPIKRFIVATNINDTVPRFLCSGVWEPKPTVKTLSNAMDVSTPNNWPRIQELFRRQNLQWSSLSYGCVDDQTTADTLQDMFEMGYISEPHAAVSYRVLCDKLRCGEYGLFLGTAHPAKFKNEIECILDKKVSLLLPTLLLNRYKLPILSNRISANFSSLRDLMVSILN